MRGDNRLSLLLRQIRMGHEIRMRSGIRVRQWGNFFFAGNPFFK